MMAIGLAIPVTLLATAGGVLLGLLGLAIRAVIRKSEMKTSQCDEPNPNAAVGHRKNMEGAALNTFGRPAAPDPTDEKK